MTRIRTRVRRLPRIMPLSPPIDRVAHVSTPCWTLRIGHDGALQAAQQRTAKLFDAAQPPDSPWPAKGGIRVNGYFAMSFSSFNARTLTLL